MLSLGDNLSQAVRAAIVLPAHERAAFISKHLRAQAAGGDVPTASTSSSSADAPAVPRAELQTELAALAEVLTQAVNADAQQ